jgi:hypothetical protein
MIANMKEFTYTTADALAVDVKAWLDQLRLQGIPARDIKFNFITTTRVLVTVTYG